MQMTQIAGVIASMLAASPAESLPTGYNIIIVAGQSNSVGLAPSITADTTPDTLGPGGTELVKQFGTVRSLGNYGTIFSGADPLTLAQGGVNSGNTSIGSQFARAYAAATGRKTLIVHVGYSNTDLIGTIKAWQYSATPANPPATTGGNVSVTASNLYANMIYEANRALTAAQALDAGSAIVGLIWAQGENDANQSITGSVYYDALSAVIDGFRAQVTGAANTWCLIGGMVPEAIYEDALVNNVYHNFRRIHRAHKRLAAVKPRTAFVRGDWGGADRATDVAGGQLGAIHYRVRSAVVSMAARALAARTAAVARTTGASVAAPGAPSIQSAVATSGQSIRVQVNRDWSQGNTDLAVRVKPSASGTWTTYYAGGQGVYETGEVVFIGGLTNSTAYDVQIADINAIGQSNWSATASVTTLASSESQYTFEDDTLGAAPAGCTSYLGKMTVVSPSGITLTGSNPAYGQSMRPTGSAGSNTWDAYLDKIPVSADRTVTFRLGKANATAAGQIGIVLRAQPDSPGADNNLGTLRGYLFLIDYTSSALKIFANTDTALTQLATTFFGAKTDYYYRVSCVGTTIKFEHSPDGVTWTTPAALTITDSTFAAGGAQFVIRNVGTPADMAVDSISWS